MKALRIVLLLITLSLAGCSRSSDAMAGLRTKWEQLKSIWGEDSEGMLASEGFYGPLEEEFVPLQEEDLEMEFADAAIPQPKEVPGSLAGGIPSLNQFRSAFADLAKIFQNVYFNTDDYVLRRPEYVQVIDGIAKYMKKHPNVHVSIAGHCDERASEAYNLALGTRRSNYIRSLVVQRGADPNRLHAVSYGKEQPVDLGHNSSSWSRNRRVEFKIYEK